MVGATGIELSYQDATGAARGNAAVASADTPAAVYHNPAGLAFQPDIAVQAGVLWTRSSTDFESPAGNVSSSHKPVVAGSAFVVYPLKDQPIVLGFGLTTPHGLAIDYSSDAPFRNRGYSGELKHAVLTAAVGYKVSDRLSFGAGLSVSDSELSFDQGLAADPDRAAFRGDGTGYAFSVGAIWKPAENHSIGLTYRSESKVDYDGDVGTTVFDPNAGAFINFDLDAPRA